VNVAPFPTRFARPRCCDVTLVTSALIAAIRPPSPLHAQGEGTAMPPEVKKTVDALLATGF
jgi:hypothetical protein